MTTDNDTKALALLAVFEDREIAALSCVGLDDPKAPDALDHARTLEDLDDGELENFGAAVAWADAAKLLREFFVLGDSVEGNSGDLVACAIGALDATAEIEGAGSDLHDAAVGAAALLRSFDCGQVVSPSDLIYLAGQAIERAVDTGAASVGSGIVEVRGDNYAYSVMIPDVGVALCAAGNSSVLR